jgi:dienelactone hydrolase
VHAVLPKLETVCPYIAQYSTPTLKTDPFRPQPQHPTHGFTFDGWIGQNDLMLRILASKGSVVCSPMMVGEKDGTGVNAAIIGGLFPGQQTSAQVVARKVYPRLVEFAPHALTQLLRISMQGDLEGANPNFPDALRNSINPNSLAMMGFSAGAAIAVYSADSLNQQWPGAVKAIVALAPTIGDFTFARDSFELAAPRITIPMLLLTGAEDGMGGLEGLVEIGDTAKNAPRIGVVVESGTHCHLYVPIGSQCDLSPRNDVGGVGAVGRFVSSAFLTAYLELPNVGFTEKSRTWYFPNPNTVYRPSFSALRVTFPNNCSTTYITFRLFAHTAHPCPSHRSIQV